VILSWLERSLQDLFKDIKSIDRRQKLIKFHLSKVGLLFEFSQAYSPRPPKEIVTLHNYSPASIKSYAMLCLLLLLLLVLAERNVALYCIVVLERREGVQDIENIGYRY